MALSTTYMHVHLRGASSIRWKTLWIMLLRNRLEVAVMEMLLHRGRLVWRNAVHPMKLKNGLYFIIVSKLYYLRSHYSRCQDTRLGDTFCSLSFPDSFHLW